MYEGVAAAAALGLQSRVRDAGAAPANMPVRVSQETDRGCARLQVQHSSKPTSPQWRFHLKLFFVLQKAHNKTTIMATALSD
jgi:hypothetical protein